MQIFHKFLLLVKKVRSRIIPDTTSSRIDTDVNAVEETADLIYDKIMEGKPLMVARYGSTELATIVNYLGVVRKDKNPVRYIFGDGLQWWWSESLIQQMQRWSGFYPPTSDRISEFCQMMLDDSQLVDILGCWTRGEKNMLSYLSNAKFVHLRSLEPFWAERPWSRALKDKRILVVHPFAETILRQYDRRELIFDNSEILPQFKSLEVIKAVQSLGEGDTRFKDWFEALEWMKKEIDKFEYDVCLIGCGAYGFPLAAHVKRRGKQAIHLGGALQLLFGIKGKRWEDPNYGVREWGIQYGSYSSLMNSAWVRPDEGERPRNAHNVEGGCYW